MCIYCVQGEGGKFCIKIVTTQHPFLRSIVGFMDGTIVHIDAYGRIRIPKKYAKQAELEPHQKVLVMQSHTGSHIEVWLPRNYDLEWRAVLEKAGIETTL